MATTYYTFEFGDQNTGYFEITETPTLIDQIARFRIGGGEGEDQEIFNIFRLKLEDGQVAAFQYSNNDWVQMSRFNRGCYPSSAYPLLLEQADPVYSYQSIHEETGEISGTLTLTRVGDCVTETEESPDGPIVRRRFWLSNGVVTKVDWGGPISRLAKSKEAAVAGSVYAE